ncbi:MULTISPECIES: hypothetical protein [Streptomyces]|uniref:Secreted protein n=1 Tax=Streptomyces venezuelae TaxID=54571 RepID=A0A5P2BCC3_STRVZ|nr:MULTISPECIES: hypothetical protein [Streptomyces]NEA02137.1 hypothetical protein [Streptomyces sp. SID10116]MYY84341.1 hypothetical protein [Streptomyces sp. SID335]MYZ17354.1 hypothetical protein [Streptomyces sp. SID337]NDZ91302.1 hypothetical protein [Streptomyces sp. SID10115]NEB48312.1 hypothetical protein [Streptomyces sp. SID339]
MHRGLVHAIAWSLATGAAVTLSWWGVHTVMAGTAYDPPRALPLAADDGGPDRAEPLASSTHRGPEPSPSKKPTKPRNPPKPSKTPTASGTHSAKPPSPSPTDSGTGTVRSYSTPGGRVVFDLGEDSATLVSATPATGWSVQTWKQDKWIRVEFTGGAARVSVFCTWHDTAPRVEVDKY